VPHFTVSARDGKITTSMDNVIEVDYKNYPGSSSLLRTDWQISPNITTGTLLRSDNTQLLVRARAF
jgi:hypothetical protein